jgi:Flp pilus assembly pilin Flp
MRKADDLLSNRDGAAAIELGLVMALVTLGILGTVIGLGSGVQSSYSNTAQKVADATP